MTVTLNDIESRTKNYRAARDLLADRLRQLDEQYTAAKHAAMPLIRSALAAAKAAESELTAGIESNPGLFKKPRTVVFHGVKVGIEKGKGQVQITDPERCVDLIRKHLGEDQFELLVQTRHTPIKTAIAQLPASDLKRIGAQIVECGDQVVIRPVDSELDKALDALLRSEPHELDQAA